MVPICGEIWEALLHPNITQSSFILNYQEQSHYVLWEPRENWLQKVAIDQNSVPVTKSVRTLLALVTNLKAYMESRKVGSGAQAEYKGLEFYGIIGEGGKVDCMDI